MDLTWSEEDIAFRQEAKQYLEQNIPDSFPEDPAEDFASKRAFQRKLADDGWVAIHWPTEYGGRGASIMQTVIYNEEYSRAGGPSLPNSLGIGLLGPTLMAYGTEEQKDRYLKKVLTAEEVWCQGFSEPNSGSDLASLQCRAELDGDEFVVNGQKIWTSYGAYADWMFALVRTDSTGVKHAGITFLLIDMHSPGIEVRPLKEMTGEALFSEVFFTDVRVPVGHVVGEVGGGWRVAMSTLMFERGAGGLAQSVMLRNSVDRLIEDAQRLRRNGWTAFDDPIARQMIGKNLVEIEVYRYTTLRAISAIAAGSAPGAEASINKLYWSEWHKSFTNDAMSILGPHGRWAAQGSAGIDSDRWMREFLFARAGTIYAGTSEIQRNILAERVLGLPKEPSGKGDA